jgi:hypothetical protein
MVDHDEKVCSQVSQILKVVDSSYTVNFILVIKRDEEMSNCTAVQEFISSMYLWLTGQTIINIMANDQANIHKCHILLVDQTVHIHIYSSLHKTFMGFNPPDVEFVIHVQYIYINTVIRKNHKR